MVRRKRRNTRRRTTAAVNPRRRRRVTALAPRRRRRVALAANPHRRRRTRRLTANPRRRRTRNPSAKGIVMGGLWAGAGAAVTNIVAGYIPIGGGGWMDVIKQLAAAWLVGFAAERVPFIGGANAQLMSIGGFAGAAWSAVNMVMSGASGFLSPQPQITGSGGVNDIIAAPSFYPGMHGLEGFGDVVPAPAFYPQGPGGLY